MVTGATTPHSSSGFFPLTALLCRMLSYALFHSFQHPTDSGPFIRSIPANPFWPINISNAKLKMVFQLDTSFIGWTWTLHTCNLSVGVCLTR
jgi:hypothetical protein